jgi:hypothetical protein
MQNKPNPPLLFLTSRLLLIPLVIGVIWAIVAGLDGYQFGSPPTGLDAIANCYQVTRVDFVVPMWRTARASDPNICSSSTGDAQPIGP